MKDPAAARRRALPGPPAFVRVERGRLRGDLLRQALVGLEDPRFEARLGPDLARRLEMRFRLDEPARDRDGGPDVEPAVHEGRYELRVDLGLGVAAHRAGDDPWARAAARVLAEQHPG